MDPSTVNSFLDQFLMVIGSGFGLIEGDVRYVLNALIVISVTLAGAQWALAGDAPLAPFFRKILFVGLFAFLINNWEMLATVLHRSGAMLGLRAGGDGMSMAELHNPGRVAQIGTEMFGRTAELGEGMNLIIDFFSLMTIYLAAIAVAIGFFILAIQIFVALIAFKLGSLAAFVALPWGVFNGTAWVAERPIGWVAGSAIRLFVLAFIGSVSVAFVDTLPMVLALDDAGALNVLFFGLTVMALAWFGPMLASEVVQGSPHLGGAEMINAGQGVAIKGALGGLALAGAVKGGIGGVRALGGLFRGGGGGARGGSGDDGYLGVFSHHPHLLPGPGGRPQIGRRSRGGPQIGGPGPGPPLLEGPRGGPPLGGPGGAPILIGPNGPRPLDGPIALPLTFSYRELVPRSPPPRKPPPEPLGV